MVVSYSFFATQNMCGAGDRTAFLMDPEIDSKGGVFLGEDIIIVRAGKSSCCFISVGDFARVNDD